MTKTPLAFSLAALLLATASLPAAAEFSLGTALGKIARETRAAADTVVSEIDDALEDDQEDRDDDRDEDAEDRDDDDSGDDKGGDDSDSDSGGDD